MGCTDKISLRHIVVFTLVSCFIHFTGSQIHKDVLCVTNACPNMERCLMRDGPGNITYLCECEDPSSTGHDCARSGSSPHDRRETCYGTACESGSFASPNYPNSYRIHDHVIMLLFIPHAVAIHFEFSSPFHIEGGKDELYVGTGLEITYDEIEDANNRRADLLLFDGDVAKPSNFTLETDIAIIYFASDASATFSGFNISWTSTVDYTPPEIVSCQSDKSYFIRREDAWKYLDLREPHVFDPDGQEIFKEVSLPEKNRFPIGQTTVRYRYADVYDNAATCEFHVSVTVDDIPPMFVGCPADMYFNLTSPNTSVEVDWARPSVMDNSAEIVSVNSTHDPGDTFVNGTTVVEYSAIDPYGNKGYCRFIVTVDVMGTIETPGSFLNELLPLLICGVIFTLISCVCCLGRTAKKRSGSSKDTSSKSNQQNNSSDNTRKSSAARPRSGAKSSVSSFDNQGMSLSTSQCRETDSSGYVTAGKSLDAIDESYDGTHL